MEIELKRAEESDLDAASALCLRSKAHWGYDATFLDTCRVELTLTTEDLLGDTIILAMAGDTMAGVVQVSCEGGECSLDKLFVAPERMGEGVGRELFLRAVSEAQRAGAGEMVVEADPDARAFYLRMGCEEAGSVPSGSIRGRRLPRLIYALRGRD